jgi:hypothetical protein
VCEKREKVHQKEKAKRERQMGNSKKRKKENNRGKYMKYVSEKNYL